MGAQLSYWVLEVKDVERAVAFYGGVFGWTFSRPRPSGGRRIWGTQPWGGLAPLPPGTEPPDRVVIELIPDDLAAAVREIRTRGGSAEPLTSPFGEVVKCCDDQGTQFALFIPGNDDDD
jgi:predicted enzyme related to lactoylglutathione lyase